MKNCFKKVGKKELTPEQEERLKNVETYAQHHGVPKTRREFLASGAILGAASIALPSALTLIHQNALAQSCVATKMPGFVTVNLNGGASLAGNVLALDAGRNPLATYAPVGLGSTANAQAIATKPFGVAGPNFVGISGFLAGLSGTTSQATRDRVSMLLFCVASNDDSTQNEFDPTPLINRAKSGAGAFLPPLGNNRNMPAVLPEVPALNVGSLADIQNAIGVQGAIQSLTAAQKEKIFRSISRMSESQSRALASTSGGDLLSALVKDATGLNVELIGNTNSGTDPQTQAGLNNVWNFNNQGQLRDASVVFNVLRGNSTAGYIEMGGYDYHGQGRANQDTRDTQAGQTVGRILETASVMNEKICVLVTSDGSVGHDLSLQPGSAPTGDRGTHGMAYALFFDPVARPGQSDSQVGNFRSSGADRIGVDEQSPIGGSPARAIAAVLANYLSFSGLAGAFESVAPRIFTTDELNQVIKIG